MKWNLQIMNGGASRRTCALPIEHTRQDPPPAPSQTRGNSPMRIDEASRQSGGRQPAHRAQTGAAFRSPYRFRKYGRSGIEVSEIFARTAEMIDEICVIRSMHADVPNHEPSLMLMNCGARPDPAWAHGSSTDWAAENQNLLGFLVMCPDGFPIAESQNWQAAFLPGIYQGTVGPSRRPGNRPP